VPLTVAVLPDELNFRPAGRGPLIFQSYKKNPFGAVHVVPYAVPTIVGPVEGVQSDDEIVPLVTVPVGSVATGTVGVVVTGPVGNVVTGGIVVLTCASAVWVHAAINVSIKTARAPNRNDAVVVWLRVGVDSI